MNRTVEKRAYRLRRAANGGRPLGRPAPVEQRIDGSYAPDGWDHTLSRTELLRLRGYAS